MRESGVRSLKERTLRELRPAVVYATIAQNASRTVHSIAIPPHAADDLLIYFTALGADTGTNTDPAGWLPLAATFDAATRQSRAFARWSDGTLTTVAYQSGNSITDVTGLAIVRNATSFFQASAVGVTTGTYVSAVAGSYVNANTGGGVGHPIPTSEKAAIGFVGRSGGQSITGIPATLPDNQINLGTSPNGAVATVEGIVGSTFAPGNWTGASGNWVGTTVLVA